MVDQKKVNKGTKTVRTARPILKKSKGKIDPWRDPDAVPYIVLEGLSKSYGNFPAVKDVDLEVYREELFSLLGSSGCGKSTLLRMLAGFEIPTKGRFTIDGVDMSHVPPYERPVNMMFQSYALFPHMTAEQNIAFGLKQEYFTRDEIRTRVKDALDLVQLTHLAKRKPHQLSGGQRQRIALARSLVKRPKLLLLDEPLGALDRKLREQTQFELVNILEEVGITTIMVTHDQEEAMTMSTRIGVMEDGYIEQVGTPTEIYEYPHTTSIAEFMGNMNLFEGRVIAEEKTLTRIYSDEVEAEFVVNQNVGVPEGSDVYVGVRPEKVLISREYPSNDVNVLEGVVEEIAYLGDVSIYYVMLPTNKMVMATTPNLVRLSEQPITWDDRVYLTWKPSGGVVLVS